MAAEPEPVAAVQANPAIEITDDGAAIVLTPASGATGDGLVFYPGAKVDPWAYAAKLSGLVEEGTTVVIVRPWLNLAFFDLQTAVDVHRPRSRGRRLGGRRPLARRREGVPARRGRRRARPLRVVLRDRHLADVVGVLSLAGSEDGLSTPQKIADARHLLPADAELVEIAGASHSSFGDYGLQPGDGTPTISDEDMTAQLTENVSGFFAG